MEMFGDHPKIKTISSLSPPYTLTLASAIDKTASTMKSAVFLLCLAVSATLGSSSATLHHTLWLPSANWALARVLALVQQGMSWFGGVGQRRSWSAQALLPPLLTLLLLALLCLQARPASSMWP